MSKADKVIITSPAGIAKFPRLTTPDTKFNKFGDYKVTLVFEDEAKGVSDFRTRIEKAEAAAHAAAKKTLKPGKKAKIADSIIKPHIDDEGNEVEGKFEVNFKSRAAGVREDGSKWERRVPVFDAAKKPVKANVGGGSVLKVAAEINDYNSPTLGAGISLRLEAVQVIELKQFSGGRNADEYGFGEEEGGYVAEDAPEGSDVTDDNAATGESEAAPEGTEETEAEPAAPAAKPRKRGSF